MSNTKIENWKETFELQASTGKYWKELFKFEHDCKLFLDASDALWICKRAQADVLESILEKIEDKSIQDIIKSKIKEVWESDDTKLTVL